MEKTINANFVIDKDSYQQMKVIAKKQDLSFSQYMRKLIRETIKSQGNGKQEKKRENSV